MEFPDDVLEMIRAFSRPCFRHYKEYNRTLHIMGIKTFPKLKECLLADPARILHALHELDVAHLAFQNALDELIHDSKTRINYLKQMDVFRTRSILGETNRILLRLIQSAKIDIV